MISQHDMDDWTDQDYLDIVDDMPESAKNITIREEGDEAVIEFKDFLIAYGQALHRKFSLKYGTNNT